MHPSGSLELGKWLHTYIMKWKIKVDVALGTALVDMYAKCGSIKDALCTFQEFPEKDVITWTALIVDLAMSGEERWLLSTSMRCKVRV